MRKIYIVILSLLSIFSFNTRLNAQAVSTYVFSPSSGTYTPLSGATTSTAAGDDGTQNVALGFNFVFGGVTYTNAVISTNGAIKLAPDGATTFPVSWTNNLSNAYGAAIIGPAWDDNNATGGSVAYLTTGASGSRTFSVEWINIHMGGVGSTTTPTATFQLTLSEGSNNARFVYGTVNPLTSSTIGIGLNDLTSFLSVTPGTPATASSITANNNITSAANLTSGTTYSFFPPPPCVPGSLAGGTTQSTVASACAGVPFTLSVTGASLGTGLTYQWESSLTGLPGSFSSLGAGATGAAYVVPNQTVATYYHRKMTCSGTDAFSTDLLVGQNIPSNCYCTVTFPFNTEPITLVNFSNINNATTGAVGFGAGFPPLEDFTAIVGNVSKGQSYPIRVKGNTDGGFTTYIDVYIDFNQDGDFVDAGENFFIGTIFNSTGVDAIEATGNILIPATALNGNTRMRVIKRFAASATPCNNTGYGQAEDYTLNITTPACLAPTGVSVGTITSNSAVVTFTSGGGTAYVEYGLAGFTPGTGATAGVGGTVITPATSPQAIAGLAANTLYTAYVRWDCGGGIFSSNASSGGSFRTLCNAITTFPYNQTFEAADPTRPCWKVDEYVVGTVNWIYATGGNGGTVTTAHGGTLNARFYQGNYNGNTTKLVSPALNLSSMTNGAIVSFWYAQEVWLGDQDQLRVYYKTSAAGPWILIPGAVYTTSISQWTEVKLFLPSSTNAPVYYVAFEGLADFGRGVLIDDVTIKAAPLVDVGITGLTLPALTCPTNGVFVQATVKNHNLLPINFATYPVTVTANITGAGTGTLSTVLNTGTLAPGASMSVYLSPSFNFSAGGTYNITVATSTNPASNDPETGNDSYSTSIVVNPNPAVPVITPPAPQICIGSSVQLTVATPPATNASVTVTTGPISVAVPDGSAAGVTNALAINGIPSTATITGISVTLNMTHTWISDIAVNLRAPNGSILNLFNRRGGSGDNLTNTVINSTSTTSLATAVPPFTGVFAPDAGIGLGPTGNVSAAANFAALYSVANGNWVLALRDYVGLDAGTLTSWSITINYSYIPALTWAPVTGLFTNAGTTTQYTAGTNAYSVYAKPDATTTYTATATGAGGCSTSATARVTVNPIPVITIGSIPDTVCISDQVIPLFASPAGGSWSGTGVSGLNFIPPATAVGAYTLTYSYTSEFGCPATATKRIVVKDCPERMILLRDNAVILYPNPNSGRFNIRINSVLYNNLGMRVYSNNGTLVRTQQFSGLAWGRVIPVDLTNLPGGLYMVKFYYEGGPRTSEKTFKVIIGTE